MTSPNNREDELQRKEQELKDRELALRLRELESELYKTEPPLHPTTKQEKPESSFKIWQRKITKIATFFAIVVGVIVAVRVASVLATAVIVGLLAFVIYKIFLERDRS